LAVRHLLLNACADILLIELYDPVTLMFFFRNKHMMCDFGTGNNNKLNWVLEDKQELIDIIETIYRGAKKGRGLVVSPKGELNICLALERMADFSQIIPRDTDTNETPRRRQTNWISIAWRYTHNLQRL
jgi:hypothetical protein